MVWLSVETTTSLWGMVVRYFERLGAGLLGLARLSAIAPATNAGCNRRRNSPDRWSIPWLTSTLTWAAIGWARVAFTIVVETQWPLASATPVAVSTTVLVKATLRLILAPGTVVTDTANG